MGKGLSFTAAKDSAQKEVLAIFGFQANNMDASENLDISVNKQENAILLAISLILQGSRSVGDLTELLANISSDLQKDGKLDNNIILANLRNSTLKLDLTGIRTNLQNRYKDLGDAATIPSFETYINDFLITTGGLLPKATTQAATSVSTTSATLNGTVNANSLSTTVTFEYGTSTSYGSSVTASQSPITGNDNTNVSANISGLTLGTTYYFRTNATSSAGTTYGTQVSFITNNVPTLTTTELSSLTGTSAISGGNISSDGGATITAKGICWNTTGNPTVLDIITNDGSGTGSFTSSFNGLTIGTTYYVRAYAINSIGTGYGNQISFTTLNIPTLSTSSASLITLTSANSGGNVTNDGGATITARGICWSTTTGPTIDLSTKTFEVGTIGIFTSSMTGLTMGTTYYVRAYASNNVGTQYGNEITFTTQNSGTVTDIEGNVYKTITIGNQTWMAENLKVVEFNDGTAIPDVADQGTWNTLTTPGYCWYNNDNAVKNIYGALYNWYIVDQVSNGGKNVCPTGWHVPTDAEWNVLSQYLFNNGFGYDGPIWGSRPEWISKSLSSNSGWTISGDLQGACPGWNQGDNNSSGFSGLPAGYLIASGFAGLGNVGKWWSAPFNGDGTTWDIIILTDSPYLGRLYESKNSGYSIRCVKD